MTARLRAWRQKIKQNSFIAIGSIIVLLALIAFIFSAYRFGWTETGFLNKTLWDWLQLLIVPFVLAVGGLLFNFATSKTDQDIAERRYQTDQIIAQDNQRETLLQIYLDRISELLLNQDFPDRELNSQKDAN